MVPTKVENVIIKNIIDSENSAVSSLFHEQNLSWIFIELKVFDPK